VQQAKRDQQTVDIPDTVIKLRKDRMNMVNFIILKAVIDALLVLFTANNLKLVAILQKLSLSNVCGVWDHICKMWFHNFSTTVYKKTPFFISFFYILIHVESGGFHMSVIRTS
jgi:hypothetical protein